MTQLIAGVARANITPPVGMLMAGYGNRKTPALGIHDELNTVALYLSDGTTEAALITVDLLAVDAEGTARVRQAAFAASGVPMHNIMVACSHTHGGPQTLLRASEPADPLKEAYTTVVVQKMAGALSEAKRNAVPIRFGHGRHVCTFGVNRRERRANGVVILGVNPEGPTMPFTDVIRLDRCDDNTPLALLFSYACHGTTLGGDNLFYTADYPGVAKRVIEGQLPGSVALFVAGCSGDVNPHPRGTYAQCERHGRRLGCAVVQAALEIETMTEDVRLTTARHEFALEVETAPSLEEAKRQLAEVQAEADAEIAAARRSAGEQAVDEALVLSWFTARRLRNAQALVTALERGERDLRIPVETQALGIGDCAIAATPGEVFVNIGKVIAERSPFAFTIPISHANGAPGYISTRDQVPLGGYEIERARANRYGLPIVPDSDQTLIEGALTALRACHKALSG